MDREQEPFSVGSVLAGDFELRSDPERAGPWTRSTAHQLSLRRDVSLWLTDRGDPEGARALGDMHGVSACAAPGILHVHEMGVADRTAYVVTDPIPGETLTGWCDQADRTLEDVVAAHLRLGRTLLVAAAHRMIPGRLHLADIPIQPNGWVALWDLRAAHPDEVSSALAAAAVAIRRFLTAWLDRRAPTSAGPMVRQALSGSAPGDLANLMTRLDTSLKRRGGHHWWLAVTLGALVAVASWKMPAIANHECDKVRGRLAAIWHDDGRAHIGGIDRGRTPSYAKDTHARVERSLQGWVADWNGAVGRACGTGATPQGAPLRCLDDHLASLEVALELLEDPEMTPLAMDIALDLPGVTECPNDGEPGPNASADEAHERARLGARLASVPTLLRVGRAADARALIDQAEAGAQAPWAGRLRLRTELARAQILRGEGSFEAAEATMTEVFLSAVREERFDLAADAATYLADWVGAQGGRPEEGLRWLRQARTTMTQHRGQPAQDTVEMLLTRSAVLHAADRYDDARTVLIAARSRARAEEGEGSLAEARVENRLAITLDMEGAFDDAIAHYEAALRGYERGYGASHPALANILSNMALNRSDAGAHGRAMELAHRARSVAEAAFGEGHPQTTIMSMNLGAVAHRGGNLELAREATQRALDGLLADGQDDHPDVARLASNLGTIYADLGRLEEALPHHDRAVAWVREQYTEPHRETGLYILNRGVALHQLGRLDQAERAFRQGLEAYEAALGPDHHLTGVAFMHLGHLALTRGDERQAAGHYAEARRRWAGSEHPPADQAEVARALAQIQQRKDRSRRPALDLAADAVRLYLRAEDPEEARAVAAEFGLEPPPED